MTVLKNKRGSFQAVILVIGALFLLVMAGVVLLFGSAVLNWTGDEVTPILLELGMVNDANVTHAVDVSVVPVNSFIQSWTWLTGVIYLLGLGGIFALAYVFRGSGDNWLIGLFFALAIILMIATIFMSNIYEEFYNGGDEFALILHEHLMLSFLILYSPAIIAIVVFLVGIILFSGDTEGGI